MGQVTGYKHEIKDSMDCETQNCIYYWKCLKRNCKAFPKCEYIGLTGRQFKTRMAERKQYVRSKNMDKPSEFHFKQQGHVFYMCENICSSRSLTYTGMA